jgi:hypothetical protein
MIIIGKIFIAIAGMAMLLIVCFVVFMGYQFYTDYKKPKAPQVIAEENYYKIHYKELNEIFMVDSMLYKVEGFNYYPKTDTTFLYVDVLIENKINRTIKYLDSFFVLKEGLYKKYYPKMNVYPEFANKTQTLKLQYILPEKRVPYLKYDLYINSKTDTAQNKFVRLYKSYRAEG